MVCMNICRDQGIQRPYILSETMVQFSTSFVLQWGEITSVSDLILSRLETTLNIFVKRQICYDLKYHVIIYSFCYSLKTTDLIVQLWPSPWLLDQCIAVSEPCNSYTSSAAKTEGIRH